MPASTPELANQLLAEAINSVDVESAITGDTALTQNKWTMKATGPDGSPVDLAGQSAEVMRRQADGNWKFLIDNPWSIG